MAHIVNRRGYLSLEESYRDPVTGKPRKRYLKYLGKLGQVDWAHIFRNDPGMAAAERSMEKAEKNRSVFATNDKVLLTHKATGETQVRFVYQSPTNGLTLKDAASGIPRSVDLNKFDLSLLESNSPDAPKRGFDINSPEMIALEEAEARERLQQEKSRLPAGLHVGPTDPVPVERTEPTPLSAPEPSAPQESQSEQAAEPDADADPSPDSE